MPRVTSIKNLADFNRQRSQSRFHHVNARHDLIEAVEDLAKRDAIAFIDTIPKGLEQWGAKYDFPALGLGNSNILPTFN